MGRLRLVDRYRQALAEPSSVHALEEVLAAATREMGFAHFALAHLVARADADPAAIQIHNYPDDWARFYNESGLAARDPILRASRLTNFGFAWNRLSRRMRMGRTDQVVLREGRRHGLCDGLTIPITFPAKSASLVPSSPPWANRSDTASYYLRN